MAGLKVTYDRTKKLPKPTERLIETMAHAGYMTCRDQVIRDDPEKGKRIPRFEKCQDQENSDWLEIARSMLAVVYRAAKCEAEAIGAESD